MLYKSIKTYGSWNGLSCCFRQWRADSHCKFLHGYPLEIRIEFCAHNLDERNWVIDFGGLKRFKSHIEATFDHKTLVAQDDPRLDDITYLSQLEVADVLVVENTGCELFAKLVYDFAEMWLEGEGQDHRVWIGLVEVREHPGNAAQFIPSRQEPNRRRLAKMAEILRNKALTEGAG